MKTKHKILIVDDDFAVLSSMNDKFSREGFTVFQASDGEEGLARAIEKHPDLIILDIAMPKMDGLEMLAKLREDSWGKGAKVILLTNLENSERIADALEHDVFDYFIKSTLRVEDIVAKARLLLGEKEPEHK